MNDVVIYSISGVLILASAVLATFLSAILRDRKEERAAAEERADRAKDQTYAPLLMPHPPGPYVDLRVRRYDDKGREVLEANAWIAKAMLFDPPSLAAYMQHMVGLHPPSIERTKLHDVGPVERPPAREL